MYDDSLVPETTFPACCGIRRHAALRVGTRLEARAARRDSSSGARRGAAPTTSRGRCSASFRQAAISTRPSPYRTSRAAAAPYLRAYLKQFEGNGHYLYHGDKGALAAHVLGRTSLYRCDTGGDCVGEYIGIAVKADSPIKSGRELIERLKKDPAAHSVGLPTGRRHRQSSRPGARIEGRGCRCPQDAQCLIQLGRTGDYRVARRARGCRTGVAGPLGASH